MSENIISYHTFMFPFRWDIISSEYTNNKVNSVDDFFHELKLTERVDINKFNAFIKNNGWKYKPFKIDESTSNYSEYVYFHPFVRNALYNSDEIEKKNTSYYYELELENANFCLETKKKTFELRIDGITLRVFDTGVAILSISLENTKYSNFNDILKINEFGRRIYPQYLDDKSTNYLDDLKNKFLANSIKINYTENNQNKEIYEDFNIEDIPNKITIGNHILGLLNIKGNHIFVSEYNSTYKNKILIEPVIDDRMFVMSFFKNNEIYNLKQKEKEKYKYFKNSSWYKYVFIDTEDKTCQSDDLSEKLITQATYDRWINYGTLYGVTKYSFVSLLSKDAPEYLLRHFKTMYFQMLNLLLAQRASVLRFSNEVSLISDLDEKNIDNKRVTDLYLHYIRFVNRLWFREVTSQEQGIEIYNLGIEQMKLDSQIKDLDDEINELNEFITLKIENSRYEEAKQLNEIEREQNKQSKNLTEIATYFLPATLLTGIFGMNIVPEINHKGWFLFIFLIVIYYLIIKGNVIVNYLMEKENSKNKNVLLLLTILIFVIFNYFDKDNTSTKKVEKNEANIDSKKESNHKNRQK